MGPLRRELIGIQYGQRSDTMAGCQDLLAGLL